MTYSNLTQEQKQAVQDIVNSTRSFAAMLARLSNLGIAIGASWNGGVSTIVNSLDDGEIIPNTSGLAGAQGVSKADTINFAGYAIDISNVANNTAGGGYNTPFHRALEVKFAGIGNTISQ